MSRSRCLARSSRPARVRHALAVALLGGLLGLASCGTVPPDHPDAHGAGSGSTRTEPDGPATLSARTTKPSHPRAPAPTSTSPSSSGSSSTSRYWVGSFRGQEIRVPRGHGATMSFTFDDGPRPGSTPEVLALLEQHHVQAVFCMIGNQARAFPSLVHDVVAGGHELCDHSRDHDVFMSRKGQAYVDAEVGDALAQIRKAAPPGTPVTFYRQPGGTWSPKVVRAMRKNGLEPLRWSDDPRDWSRPGSTAIVRRVVSQLRPGAIVLMHDGGGDRAQSVEALRFLLDAVVAAGWKPVLPPHVALSDRAAAKPQ